jgi:hypothetical protein
MAKKAPEAEPLRAVREGFDYRPRPQEYEGANIPPFPNKAQERNYEQWRSDMVFDIWGPQDKPSGPKARAHLWYEAELKATFHYQKKVHRDRPLVVGNTSPWVAIGIIR